MRAVRRFKAPLSLSAVFVLMGPSQVWMPSEKITEWIGAGSGLESVAVTVLLGTMPTGPLYVAFPVAATLLGKGAWRCAPSSSSPRSPVCPELAGSPVSRAAASNVLHEPRHCDTMARIPITSRSRLRAGRRIAGRGRIGWHAFVTISAHPWIRASPRWPSDRNARSRVRRRERRPRGARCPARSCRCAVPARPPGTFTVF